MDAVRWLLALLLIVAPVAWYLWREARDKKPEVLWKELGPELGLAFSAEPPMLRGAWNGREVSLVFENGRPVASSRYSSGARVRLEVGDRGEVEKASGLVVPDRVEFPEDSAFSRQMLVRATPEEFGRLVVDPTMRARLLRLSGAHLLASGGRVDVSVPEATREEEFRELFDVAVAVAEAAEQA